MISIVLSRLALFLMSLSLVRYVFLFLSLCTFTCSGVRGSLMVLVCPFFSTFLAGIFPFYHLFTFPYTYSIMRTSSRPNRPSSLRIRGSSTEGSDLGKTGEGSGCPAIVVNRVPSMGPPSPHGKGKGKVSEIMYPGSSAYFRAAVQNVEAVGPSRVEPSFGHNFASRNRPPFGALTSSLPTLFKSRRWFASSRRPLRMASASLYIPLSNASCSISMFVQPNSLSTSRASWSGCWSSSGIKVSRYIALRCS